MIGISSELSLVWPFPWYGELCMYASPRRGFGWYWRRYLEAMSGPLITCTGRLSAMTSTSSFRETTQHEQSFAVFSAADHAVRKSVSVILRTMP